MVCALAIPRMRARQELSKFSHFVSGHVIHYLLKYIRLEIIIFSPYGSEYYLIISFSALQVL